MARSIPAPWKEMAKKAEQRRLNRLKHLRRDLPQLRKTLASMFESPADPKAPMRRQRIAELIATIDGTRTSDPRTDRAALLATADELRDLFRREQAWRYELRRRQQRNSFAASTIAETPRYRLAVSQGIPDSRSGDDYGH